MPPVVDAFASATQLGVPPSATTFDNSAFTSEASEPSFAITKSGWAIFTPTVTGVIQLDTIGSARDTKLAVYTGASLAALTLVTSDDDSGGSLTSKLQFLAVAQTQYSIQVGDQPAGAGGSITLNLTQINYQAKTLSLTFPTGAPTAKSGFVYKGRDTAAADSGSVA